MHCVISPKMKYFSNLHLTSSTAILIASQCSTTIKRCSYPGKQIFPASNMLQIGEFFQAFLTSSPVSLQISGSALTRELIRQNDLWSRFPAGLSTAVNGGNQPKK